MTWHRNDVLIDELGHVTDLIVDEAIHWIESRGSAPFFLYVPFSAVHLPIREPQAYLDAVPESIVGNVPRQYAASVMHLDDAVGKIIATLEKTGHREDTLLVFTSDNGGSTVENNDTKYPADDYASGKLPGNNLPLRGIKGDLYEGGIRVPTIVSWPGKLSPSRIEAPVHIADWMPTLCGLVGYQPSSADDLRWDGVNVWPLIEDSQPATPRTLYWVGPRGRSKAVRHGDWKWITHQGDEPNDELFALANDPNEKRNVAARHPQRVTEFQKRLAEVSAADNDRTVAQEVIAQDKDTLQLTLPPVIYAVPNVEISLYFDNVVLTPTPQSLSFFVDCGIGQTEPRRWVVNPKATDVGTRPLTVRVESSDGVLLGTATTQLQVTSADAGNGKPIRRLISGSVSRQRQIRGRKRFKPITKTSTLGGDGSGSNIGSYNGSWSTLPKIPSGISH